MVNVKDMTFLAFAFRSIENDGVDEWFIGVGTPQHAENGGWTVNLKSFSTVLEAEPLTTNESELVHVEWGKDPGSTNIALLPKGFRFHFRFLPERQPKLRIVGLPSGQYQLTRVLVLDSGEEVKIAEYEVNLKEWIEEVHSQGDSIRNR
ncbi:MAG: hypothetical protein DWQ01_10855 [Planctomycetota bacterium]|nr:MAG: hypothetical protein DWQ01_10855 [Planctomycetota bacterium]